MRWVKIGFDISRICELVEAAKAIPGRFQPRIRWVFIRFIFNGWFTGRRMQTRRACRFCGKFQVDQEVEDSIARQEAAHSHGKLNYRQQVKRRQFRGHHPDDEL